MGDGLLYLKDTIDGEVKTFEFTPEFNDAGKVVAVSVSVYGAKLTEKELYNATVESFVNLDVEGWATLLAWVRAVMESKKL